MDAFDEDAYADVVVRGGGGGGGSMRVQSGETAGDVHDDDRSRDAAARQMNTKNNGGGKGVTLRFVKPCARCVMPSVDQDSGARGGLDASPLPTLGEMRSGEKLGFRAKWADEKYFGWNVVTDDVGEVNQSRRRDRARRETTFRRLLTTRIVDEMKLTYTSDGFHYSN